jgi:DNA invertase Pin-like site-specific DNA recombinase
MQAQREAISRYVQSGILLSEFIEVESGKLDERPQLAEALALCRRQRATLVIAKLDRLARSVRFIAELMDSSVEFIACDLPSANRLTLHIMAAMAEHEREMTSQRTKEALEAAKARGTRLGFANPARTDAKACGDKGRVKAVAVSALVRGKSADAHAADMLPVIQSIMADGKTSLRAIAQALNERGERTARGGEWKAESVRRVLNRV